MAVETSQKQAATQSKARYLVAVFSVLVVCIVAVLVVTVASQARNNIKQTQQTDDNIEALSSSQDELRHPRFIRPTTFNNQTFESNESIILKSLKALVMRVVTPTANETVSNASGHDQPPIVPLETTSTTVTTTTQVFVNRK